MKTEKELNNDILKITLTIQEKFPELSKYIAEMPVTIPDIDDPENNTTAKNLGIWMDHSSAESQLLSLGAFYSRSPDYKTHVVTDGNLVTGQNPASSVDTAKAVKSIACNAITPPKV